MLDHIKCLLLSFVIRFSKLTERFFKTNPWPDAEVVAPIVQNGNFYSDINKKEY